MMKTKILVIVGILAVLLLVGISYASIVNYLSNTITFTVTVLPKP